MYRAAGSTFLLARLHDNGPGLGRQSSTRSFVNVGDAAPAWTDLPGVDDKTHSLAELKDKDVVVLVFTCNHCPVAEDYEDRIIEFNQKHATPASKVVLVAISVSNLAEDKLPRMKERGREEGL